MKCETSLFPGLRLIVFAALVSFSPLYAQTGERESRRLDLSLWFAGATGEENSNSFSEAQILSAGAFVGRTVSGELGSGWRRGSLEYGFDIVPVVLQVSPKRLYGRGLYPVVLRWNSAADSRHIAPYIELGGGGLQTSSNFPAGNTSRFNFMVRGGGGIELFHGAHHSMDLACRWWHISNANLGVRNPEFNGIQFGFGYHWFK